MLNKLFERQAALQPQIEKYAPIREVFEAFLEAGQREDLGFLSWCLYPDPRRSRYNWEREETVTIASGRKVVVEAFTDPTRRRYGHKAGDIQDALIDVRVSLPETPTVTKELELFPVWAILEQDPETSCLDLDKLVENLEEIAPLIRALLPQS